MPKTREEMTRRRQEILHILDSGIRIETLDDLLDQLEIRGIKINKSSVSRDLQDLGIVRVGGRYQAPAIDRDEQVLQRMADFIRDVVPSGPYVAVIRCDPGAGRLVSKALKSLGWEEITGMVADDDTAVVCTAHNPDQKLFLSKLKRITERRKS